ncbi:MAG TPA: hypothetical protein VNT52_12810 [Acidimicrobiales bacterium]|nr:hypothetical protein [Acidimicrobiales bacterium]
MPNNRELATLLWLVVLFGVALSRPGGRSSLRGLVRTALSPTILVPLAVLAAWVSALVYAASSVGLWDKDLATDTVFWFFFAGLVLFGNFTHASREEHFFRRKVLAVLKVGVAVEVFSDFFVLNLPVEVFLVLLLTVLVGVSAVATLRHEYKQVKAVVDWLIAAITFGILGYVAVSLLNNWGVTDKGSLAREFALPVWLTVGVLPYVYAVGLLDAYGSVFRRIDWRSGAGRWARVGSKLALLSTFHVRAREVGKISARLEFGLASTSSFREARRMIRDSSAAAGERLTTKRT